MIDTSVWYTNNKNKIQQQNITDVTNITENKSQNIFGFIPTLYNNVHTNKLIVISNMTPYVYLRETNIPKLHNFCKTTNLPLGAASLVSLGHKLCLETPIPNQNLNKGIMKLKNTIRWQQHFKKTPSNKTIPYIPELYNPTGKKVPIASTEVELQLNIF